MFQYILPVIEGGDAYEHVRPHQALVPLLPPEDHRDPLAVQHTEGAQFLRLLQGRNGQREGLTFFLLCELVVHSGRLSVSLAQKFKLDIFWHNFFYPKCRLE